jgi:superfamily II DNA or RNA helicase
VTVEEAQVPRIGMVATVRNRRGIVSGVRPHDGHDGRLHLVDIEYNDGDHPLEETILWEREPFARLQRPASLPDPLTSDPMKADDLLALVRACRWSARSPFIDPDGSGPMVRLPVSSPFHGAVQVEDYQLMPLLKALRMPRVSLLIADDVGLGKTIEAGLILSELLLRRRIRRVLILTPAALRLQWRDEMWDKFSLQFDVVDRDSTMRLRRSMGMDANPWRSHSRIISSYHYLKQPDILEQFRSASQHADQGARLPWDLLIVDEVHNLTPDPFGEESDLCSMLRQVAPWFEHRLFLTATPHNGHTRSFTGLLEMLDPVRFSQSDELRPAERARVQDVLVRRLKREINERSNPKRFCERQPPQALLVELGARERDLVGVFSIFRARVRELVAAGTKRERMAGTFAIEVLGKRLLSCPMAFSESWLRLQSGLNEDSSVGEAEVLAARKAVAEETVDDREAESRRQTAAATIGTWLRPMADDLRAEMAGVQAAVEALGFHAGEDPRDSNPKEDARYEGLLRLIVERLQDQGPWLDTERLVVFTEYKTTLDYLLRRLRADLGDDQRILRLFGGMGDAEREAIKDAFNDPEDSVRILLATDAASEGLNLQETARYLLHYDIPWNPARLEQRNGRLDRHGQSRDVTVWHFVSDDDQDLAFLDLVVRKVDAIREDLGATGEVFDEITYRRLIEGEPLEDVRRDLDDRTERARRRADIPRDSDTGIQAEGEVDPAADLAVIASELDLDPGTLRTTLDSAMALAAGRPRVSEPDQEGRSAIVQPHPSGWAPVIDDTVRLPPKGGKVGALPGLAFSPAVFVKDVGGLPVFRPRRDTILMHLAHPMLQKTLSSLTRQRFPGGSELAASRWGVFKSSIPNGVDALIQLTVEQLAINELRETFHHWVRTLRFAVKGGRLGSPLPHCPATELRPFFGPAANGEAEMARDLWSDVGEDVREWLQTAGSELTQQLKTQLEIDRERSLEDENQRYQSRQGEVSHLIESSTLARLEREMTELKARRDQGELFDQERRLDELDRDIQSRTEEVERRKRHYEEVRTQLAAERERVIGQLIPRRHSLRGDAQVLPIAVDIILPGGAV